MGAGGSLWFSDKGPSEINWHRRGDGLARSSRAAEAGIWDASWPVDRPVEDAGEPVQEGSAIEVRFGVCQRRNMILKRQGRGQGAASLSFVWLLNEAPSFLPRTTNGVRVGGGRRDLKSRCWGKWPEDA